MEIIVRSLSLPISTFNHLIRFTIVYQQTKTMNKEIQSLVNQLNAASDAYYNGRDELMTDYEWDAAFDKLKKLEEETGIILPRFSNTKCICR